MWKDEGKRPSSNFLSCQVFFCDNDTLLRYGGILVYQRTLIS